MPISFVHPFLIEIYASVSVGWFANLLQNLKVDLRALLANVPSHLCPKINTTSLNELERSDAWLAAYSSTLQVAAPPLTDRDSFVLRNVLLLRLIGPTFIASPVREPSVLDLRTARPDWPKDVLENVKPTPFLLGNFNVLHRTLLPCSALFLDLITGFREGFRLGYRGDRNTRWKRSDEPADPDLKIRTLNMLSKETQAGRMIGPLRDKKPTFLDFLVVSPIYLIPKKSNGEPIPDKFRLIHNLSWGKLTGTSVNDGIDKAEFEVKYIQFDEICDDVLSAGCGSRLWKSDMVDAFKIGCVHPDDIPLLGISFLGNLYLDTRLVFWRA